MTIRVDVYVRKSSERDERQMLSLEAQLDKCQELALANGLTVVKIFQEAKSAKMAGCRPQFDELLKRCENGAVDGIVAYDPNRLARNEEDGFRITKGLRKKTIKMVYFSTFVFQENASGFKQLNNHFTDAVYFSEQLGEDIRRGNMQCFKHGRRAGGTPPVGYSVEGSQVQTHAVKKERGYRPFEPHPENFEKVGRIFARFLTFQYTVKEISKFGNDELQLRSPKGRKYSLSVYYKMLSNPFYSGILLPPKSAPPGTAPIIGKHKPVITVEEHKRIKEHLLGHNHRHRHHKDEFLFKFPFLKCECGGTVKAGYTTKKLKSGQINKHKYYFCVDCGMSWKEDAPMKASHGYSRKAQPARASLADMFLRDVIQPLRLSPEAAAYRRAVVKQQAGQQIEIKARKKLELESRLAALNRKRQNAYDVLLESPETKDLFAGKTAGWDIEKAELERELRELEDGTDECKRGTILSLNLAEHIEKLWVKGDYSRKREIIKLVTLNLILGATTIKAEYNYPFLPTVKMAKMKNGGGAGSRTLVWPAFSNDHYARVHALIAPTGARGGYGWLSPIWYSRSGIGRTLATGSYCGRVPLWL